MIERDEQLLLLQQAREGDVEALETLLRQVQPQLYRFSMKMCRHTQDAEDVLQDSMLTLARSFKDFKGMSSLSTWLFTIVRSFCIKKRRKSKFSPGQEASLQEMALAGHAEPESSLPNPEKLVESAEVWREVHAAIQRIEPAYREVLVLRDIEGLSAKEVAEIVDLSVGAVKSRLHRARAQLRSHLAPGAYRPKPGCPDIRKVFSRHLEGELSSEICSSMEAHVSQCDDCAHECNGLRQALSLCTESPCDVPKSVQARVQLALRKTLSEQSQ